MIRFASALTRLVLPIVLMSGVAAGPADADIRYFLQASVAERCGIAEIDAEDLSAGVLRVETQCNAERFVLQLASAGDALSLDEVQAPGVSEVRVRDGQVWIAQQQPGRLLLEIHLEAPENQVQDRLSIRLEVI